jgi:hypothetical protein
VLVADDGFACALDGVAGTARVSLLDEANAGGGYRGFHPLRLVADDDKDMGRIDNLAGCCDYMPEQGLAADLMQHLGPTRFEPRALAGRHDDYR